MNGKPLGSHFDENIRILQLKGEELFILPSGSLIFRFI